MCLADLSVKLTRVIFSSENNPMKIFTIGPVAPLIFILAVCETTTTDCIWQPNPSKFIKDTVENRRFFDFRDQYWTQMWCALNEELRQNEISEWRINILEDHRNEIIDVCLIDEYNRNKDREGIYSENHTLFCRFIRRDLCLDRIALISIPVNAIKFLECKALDMKNTDIDDSADVGQLRNVESLRFLNISHNRIKTLPRFKGSGVACVFLNYNPIEINHPEDIETDGPLECLYLFGVNVKIFAQRLLRTFKMTGVNKSPPSFVFRELYKPVIPKVFLRNRGIMDERYSNRLFPRVTVAFVSFLSTYERSVRANLENLLSRDPKTVISDERKVLLAANLEGISLLATAHYYNRMYLHWWLKFEGSQYLLREIRDDIEAYNFTNITRLLLDNTGFRLIDIEAMKFFDAEEICMMNTMLNNEEDVVKIEELGTLEKLRTLMLEYNSLPRVPDFENSNITKISLENNQCPVAIPTIFKTFHPNTTIILDKVQGISQSDVEALMNGFGTIKAFGTTQESQRLNAAGSNGIGNNLHLIFINEAMDRRNFTIQIFNDNGQLVNTSEWINPNPPVRDSDSSSDE